MRFDFISHFVKKDELLHAIHSNNLDTVDNLLDNGHDVNSILSEFQIPSCDFSGIVHQYYYLHYAIKYATYPIIKRLVERGADVNVLDRWLTTLSSVQTQQNTIEMAIFRKDSDRVIKLLLDYGFDTSNTKGNALPFNNKSELFETITKLASSTKIVFYNHFKQEINTIEENPENGAFTKKQFPSLFHFASKNAQGNKTIQEFKEANIDIPNPKIPTDIVERMRRIENNNRIYAELKQGLEKCSQHLSM